jgi:hypothetical protein
METACPVCQRPTHPREILVYRRCEDCHVAGWLAINLISRRAPSPEKLPGIREIRRQDGRRSCPTRSPA